MRYPREFPRAARAQVEAETIHAYRALEQEVRGIERWRRDVPFIRCALRVFLVFAREACEFGKKTGRHAWSDHELDQRCREFLLTIVIDAWENKGKDLGIGKIFSSQHWGYSLDDDARRKIEKSPEWEQYQKLLLDALESQANPHLRIRASKELPGLRPPKTRMPNSKYKAIDAALRHIAESRPRGHEEVFRALEGRADLPNAKPFADAVSWLTAFNRDRASARAWLSKAWSRLDLPGFSRGPK